MNKKHVMLALTVFATLPFCACGNGHATPAFIPPSLQAAAFVSPGVSPSVVAPTESPTDSFTGLPLEMCFDNSLSAHIQFCDIIVRGKFTKKLEAPYNQIRDQDDPSLPDEKEKRLEWQFVFEVTELYMNETGADIPPNSNILINLAYEENNYMTGYKLQRIKAYFEPEFEKEIVLFLCQNSIDASHLYPDVAPFYFEIREEVLYPRDEREGAVKSFEANTGIQPGEGVPISQMKELLGL